MPEPLKYLYNEQYIKNLCTAIKKHHKSFNSKEFTASIFNANWEGEELKQRMRHITHSLFKFLPSSYKTALSILKPASPKFGGFEGMFFPDFVECYGLNNYIDSISALEFFTQYSSSEFAVRPFIIQYENKMMAQMEKWSKSKNHHIRRLASEGCRPRLPWAMALPIYKKEPAPVLNIILTLLNDDSEYVRRSVANNLNDISKDHPKTITKITKQNLGTTQQTDKLLKHACRTLLKAGDAKTLSLFGFSSPNHINIQNFVIDKKTTIGEYLNFSFFIKTKSLSLGKVRLEYAIGFMKANGNQSQKVFKISEATYNESSKSVIKRHSFKIISTRKYYAGLHRLSIIVNGQEMADGHFQLTA